MKIWSPFFVSKKTKNNKSVWYAHFPDPDDSQKRKVRSVEILRSQLGSADTSPIRRKVEAIKYYSLIIDSSFSINISRVMSKAEQYISMVFIVGLLL
jgi:hypothetical protein